MDESDQQDLKRRLRTEWADMAETWIGDHAGGRDNHREGLLDSWMLEAAGEVSSLDVIDLGCGEGRFSRMLAERGAKVTGVDMVERFIAFADGSRVGNETYLLGDMEDLSLAAETFDVAVSYVTLVDVVDFRSAITEAFRVLRQGGRFLVCNLQPMVTAGNGWIKHGNDKLHFKLDDYFDEGTRAMPFPQGTITNFHRTLSSYTNTFLETGFVLEGIREPKPSLPDVQRTPGLTDNLRVPYFIIYLLRKP